MFNPEDSRPDQVRADVTRLYGIPVPTKRRALLIDQGQSAVVSFQLFDTRGNPVNLAPFALCGPQGPQFGSQGFGAQSGDICDYNVTVRFREAVALGTKQIYEARCTVEDAETGVVTFEPPTFVANNPGVWSAEFGVFKPIPTVDADQKLSTGLLRGYPLAFTNKCYVWVDRGLFGDPMYPNYGPPTVDEVRLFIRDNGPEENLLLDDFEFDLAEICQGAENAVRYWNEVNPPINVLFSTTTFCVRHKWLQAIAAHMMKTAAHRFRRNHLPYQAGGVSVDDQNKFQQYDQIGEALMQEYREWVKTKKVQLNCEAAISSSGSPYGWTAYQLLNAGI